MAITPAFCPLSLQALLDRNGVPIAGGKVYMFDAQTTNPRLAYRDDTLSTSHPNPVLTDAFGRIPVMWFGPGKYKLVLKDKSDVPISTADNLPGGTDDSAETPVVGTVIPTGFVMPAHSTDIVDGWLPCNGLTIGNAQSTASARANADVQALFTKLWNQDASLTVLGGRGPSATQDWAAAKTIALPDYRGCTLVGLDGMGTTLAGRITAAVVATANVLGSFFGFEKIVLTGAQLPAITPAVAINAAGGHSHTGSTGGTNDGQHSHSGTTDTAGAHTHNYQKQNGGIPYNPIGTNPTPADALSTATATSAAGDHSHSVTLGGGGHSHGLNINGVGDHSHTGSVAALGNGDAHPNVQPSVLVTWHIKL